MPLVYSHFERILSYDFLGIFTSHKSKGRRGCTLLKHKLLIGLLYGCGLRCLEVRSVRLADLDFDRKQLKVVQGKGKKDRYVPLSEHLIRGLIGPPTRELYFGRKVDRSRGDFDSRYSQKGVQWAVKEAAKRAGIIKEVHVHTLRHTCATHLLEDGMDIISVKNFLGHENIETTIRTADAAIPACSSVADQTCFQSA